MPSQDIKIIDTPLEELQNWDQNPRFISDESFRRLCSLMKRKPDLLWKNPIHANKDGRIYSGNMRYRAAQALGWETIPAVVSKELMSDAQMKEEAIILNHHHGENQKDELAQQLFELDEAGIDVYALGVQETVVNSALDQVNMQSANEDDEDSTSLAIPVKGITKTGDMWRLGDHYVLCGDATKIEDVEKLMSGSVADMVFTDPPYNVDYEGKTADALKIENDSMEDGQFLQFLTDAFVNLYAATKAGGGIYICHADSEGYNFRKAMQDAGWLMKQCIVWVKNTIVMGRKDYQWQHEPILYGWKDGASHCWYGGRDQSTVWNIAKPARSGEHPTMKPIELVAKAIRNSSERGQTVLDVFGGSGSTLIACEKLQRKCRTLEMDPKYVDVIVRRWEEFTGEKAELVTTNLLKDSPEYMASVGKPSRKKK